MERVIAGQGHTCVLASGRMHCWGWDEDGQLGNGTTAFAYAGPLLVPLDGVTAMEAGYTTTCAIRADGTVWCWGHGARGVADTSSPSAISAPIRWGSFSDAVQVAAGNETCVRRAGGQVHCSRFGGGTAGEWPRERVEWLGATDVDVGSDHACVVLDGGVSCIGENDSGQVGTGTTSTYAGVTSVSLPESVVDVALSTRTSCARGLSGRVYCWGDGSDLLTGPFGAPDTTVPQAIPGTVGAQALECGQGFCCVHFGGVDVRCWGDNYNGQIGDGTGGSGVELDTPSPVDWP